ncbi:uncharacterized protein [Rutidosis leptorrhynchoides]|uniref:uncharacterized protein n=1 Tax=Rutidosis leptorrhynchoides TaxID=125765 RepID=UPI003A991060
MWRHYLYGTKYTIFTNHKSLQHILNKKQLNMRQRCWAKPLRVRALNLIVHTNLTTQIRDAQLEALKEENMKEESLRGLEKQFEIKGDGTRYFAGRIWVPRIGEVRKKVVDEAHKTRYSIHPGGNKMYHDLKMLYWWLGMKANIATYVGMCLTCSKETDKMEKLAQLYLKEVVSRHDGQSERTIQTLGDMLRACVIDFGKGWDRFLPFAEFSYNNSYHSSIQAAPFEALYGQKCRSSICWNEVGDRQLTGPEIIHETTEHIVKIKQRLPPQLAGIHDTFHVSNLRKCLAQEDLVVPLEEIQIDDKLNFVEEPAEIMDRKVKGLRQSKIPIVKVHWNAHRGPEFTWECEDQMKEKYPHLFANEMPAV